MNLTIRQNLTNSALSQYTNFFFDRGIVSLGDKTLALKCDSLCLLGGDTDNGADVPAEVQTGVTDFGDGEKRVRSIHVKGQFDDADSISVKYAMDSFTPDFSCVAASTSALGNSGSGNLKFQGVRARRGEYLSLSIKNISGAKFYITQIIAFLIRGVRR